MARGFDLLDIACITLEGSLQASPSASPPACSGGSCQTITTNTTTAQHLQQQKRQKQKQTTSMPQQHQRSSSSSSGSSSNHLQEDTPEGGLLASGLGWFDKQREKRRREHLKLEAQKQLQKIGEAQRAAQVEREQQSLPDSIHPNRSLVDSSSVESDENEIFDTNYSEDSSGIIASNSSISIENSNSGSKQQQRQQQYYHHSSHSFGTSDVSKSGEGASGMLSLSDIDGICGEQETNQTKSTAKEQTGMEDTNNEDDDDVNDDIIGPVRVSRMEGDDESPYILSQTQMNEISKHVLPETIKYCRWRRLYGLGRDGDSFDGCLRIIGSSKRTLMVVRTTRGDIFGGYADAPWHSRHASATAKFYGSASSCLYSFSHSTKATKQTTNSPSRNNNNSNASSAMESESKSKSSPINVYRWTGKNRYIQVCDVSNKMLAFGGGGDKGAFGLCLQEDFQRGTTGHCDTFDNDPLCSGQHNNNTSKTFDIVDVEFWEFLTGVF